MNISEKISEIQASVQPFGYSAVIASNNLVVVRNAKNLLCAKVSSSGVEQLYAGSKNLCGSLVRNAILKAITF